MDVERNDNPVVICICGVLAAGKTTLIHTLSQEMAGSAVLVFDEYAAYCEWPQDIDPWIASGCDPAQVSNVRLRHDLQALRAGVSICSPMSEERIEPTAVILLEDPFGRTRRDNGDLIDLVLFVDLPWDLSVVRMVRRALGMGDPTKPSAFGDESKDDLVARFDAAQQWLSGYVSRRAMYTILSAPVRETADIILDGTQTATDVLAEALRAINRWRNDPRKERIA